MRVAEEVLGLIAATVSYHALQGEVDLVLQRLEEKVEERKDRVMSDDPMLQSAIIQSIRDYDSDRQMQLKDDRFRLKMRFTEESEQVCHPNRKR